jgi:hypothetical protein
MAALEATKRTHQCLSDDPNQHLATMSVPIVSSRNKATLTP